MDDDEVARKRRSHTSEPPSHRSEEELTIRERKAASDDVAADLRDSQAKSADKAASARDRMAAQRDAETEALIADASPETVRRRATEDRGAAARDRESSLDDRFESHLGRRHSRRDRVRAADDRDVARSTLAYVRDLADQAEDKAEDMLIIGQAQGRLMEAQGISAAEALLEVFKEAAHTNANLAGAAQTVVKRLPGRGG